MSDPHHEPADPLPPEAGEMAAPVDPVPSPVTQARSADRSLAIGLACALVVLAALAGTAPFWAPALPWGPPHLEAAMAQRLDHVEATQQQLQADQQKLASAQQQTQGLGQRLDKLEAAQQQVQAVQKQVEAVQQQAQTVQQRLDALDRAQQQLPDQLRQALQQQDEAENKALQPLEQRLAALEAKPAVSPGDIEELRGELGKLSDSESGLSGRLDKLEQAARSQAASDASGTASLLALLQIRDALDTGRPFTPAYDALRKLSDSRPDVGKALAPLADPAKTGVATRAVLIERLRALAPSVAASPKPTKGSWADAALNRLEGLVSIQRIDGADNGAPANSPEAAVNTALRQVAAGDLRDGVGTLEQLTGAAAETVRPWLQMARQRLAVETAVQNIEGALAAQLGQPAPPAAAAPGSAG